MTRLNKIIQTLILNGTLTEQPGLFHGKTGIAIFFFHYARHTGNELFQDYAMELIEGIMKQLTFTFPARYDMGLAGIGTGFEYLLQSGFLEEEDNQIFEDFDMRMFRAVMYEPYPNLSLHEGLTGWGRYLMYRVQGSGKEENKLLEALQHIANELAQKIADNTVESSEQSDVYRFLKDLVKLPSFAVQSSSLLQQIIEWKCIREPEINLVFPNMDYLYQLYSCQKYFDMELTQKIEAEWRRWEMSDYNIPMGMGISNGWSGQGLLYLTLYHGLDISWINLM